MSHSDIRPPLSSEKNVDMALIEFLGVSKRKLAAIWDKLGIVGEARKDRENVMLMHVRNLVAEMVDEEEKLTKRVQANILKFKRLILQMSMELNVETPEFDDGLALLQQEKELKEMSEQFSVEMNHRRDKLKQLRKVEEGLCSLLQVEPYYMDDMDTNVPSNKQLFKLEEHIQRLEDQKLQRQDLFRRSKLSIEKLVEELEINPDTSFQNDVICEDIDTFLLTTSNMEALETFHHELEAKKLRLQSVQKQLLSEIQNMWVRLSIPEEEKTLFLETFGSSLRPSSLDALGEELDRLKELRKVKLRSVVESALEELQEWWKKCYMSEESKEAFEHCFTEFTEESLEKIDNENTRLRQLYENNRTIFESIAHRESLWLNYIDLENKANDPLRYSNRGGNLLKEEKERNRLKKELPKVEKSIELAIVEWEEEHGVEFLVHGKRYPTYVADQWEDIARQRELEKLQRQQQKSKLLEKESLYGAKATPTKKRQAASVLSSGIDPKRRKFKLNETNGTPYRLNGTTNTTSGISMMRARLPLKPTAQMSYMKRRSIAKKRRSHASKHNHSSRIDSGIENTLVQESGNLFNADSNSTLASVGHYFDFAASVKGGEKVCPSSTLVFSYKS